MTRPARHLVLWLFVLLQCLLPLLHAHAAGAHEHAAQHGIYLDGVEFDELTPSLHAATHEPAGIGVELALPARAYRMAAANLGSLDFVPAQPSWPRAFAYRRPTTASLSRPKPLLAERPLVPYPCAPPRL